jgi:integrase
MKMKHGIDNQENGIVSTETNLALPTREDFEKMGKRRFQNPRPKRRGNSWTLLFWRDEFENGKLVRKRVRETLAPASVPYREVEKIASELLRPQNQGLITVGSASGFEHYVKNVYIPTDLPLMAASTRNRYEGILKNYLLPTFGDVMLRDMTPLNIQKYLSGMAASELSHESKDKIRDVLSSVMGSAKKYGLVLSNPVEGLRLPPRKRGKSAKPHITPEQFHKLLQLISEPYATMVYVAVHTGLRVSELIALRWKNVHEDSITIEERCCRGDWGAPKSDASNATIAVNTKVIQRIQALKDLIVTVKGGRGGYQTFKAVKSSQPGDLVFQSVRQGKAMRDNNILCRYIKPAGALLGIPWVNWRCLRTSHATWLKKAGVHVRDAQTQMRHSKASTTLDIYMQTTDEHQREAISKLESFSMMIN